MDRVKWANDLIALATKLDTVTCADLRGDDALYDECRKLIHRFVVIDSDEIEDQVQYPPEWDNLGAAVEGVAPNVLLDNMWGWVSEGRWMDTPLADVHEKGWLVPAFRRLATNVEGLNIEPGVDF